MMSEPPGRMDAGRMDDPLMNPPPFAYHPPSSSAHSHSAMAAPSGGSSHHHSHEPSSSEKPASKESPKDDQLIPKAFPTRLSLPNDNTKLSPLHCFLREELLEIFVVKRSAKKTPMFSPESSVGRVGLRCVFCSQERQRLSGKIPNDEAPMAVFYPKSIGEIYRLIISWQRCHLRKCRNLPPDMRNKWTMLREKDKSRGKTQYWLTSAQEIGLVDCNSRAGGIRFSKSTIAASYGGTRRNGDDSDDDADMKDEEKPSSRAESGAGARKTPSPENDDKEKAKKEQLAERQRTVSPTNSNEEKQRGGDQDNWAPPKTGIPTKEHHSSSSAAAAAPPEETMRQQQEDALLKKLQQSEAMLDPSGAPIDDQPLPLSHGTTHSAAGAEPLLLPLPSGSSESAKDQKASSKKPDPDDQPLDLPATNSISPRSANPFVGDLV